MTLSENGNGTVGKKADGRSPSWPAIPLEEAIQRADTVYDHEKRHPTSQEVLSRHWGYSPKSSSGRQIAAALKSFDLLESVGGNLRISDSAWRILNDPDKKSSTRLDLVRQAALSPKIHQEIWEKYGEELPSDSSLKTFLIFEKKFNKNGVEEFIDQYKKTMEFAGLLRSSHMMGEEENNNQKSLIEPSLLSEGIDDGTEHAEDDSAIFVMSLPRNNKLEIRVSKKLSYKEYDNILNDRLLQVVKFSLAEPEE